MSPLYIGIIIAGVGLLLALVGVLTRRKASRILAAPLMKTGEASRANGPASVQGTVRTQQPLIAPCTSTPCVYYQLKIEKKVKTKQGGQVQTSWKKVIDQHFGSVFGIDDGTGMLPVHAQDAIDGDLEQSFSGAPPGGPGLGALAGLVPSTAGSPNEEILEYRVTEKVLRADSRAFVLGSAQAGQLTKPGTAKLLVSTRGRDALVGSTKKKALAFLVVGGLATAGGATVAVVRPGEAPPCGDLVDMQAKCMTTSTVVTDERVQPDGSKKKETFRREILKWKVTKGGKFELAASDPKKRDAYPSIQVENSIGIPMNIGLNWGLGAGAFSTKTTTANLSPGNYTVYVWSNEKAPEHLVLDIHEAPAKK
jgi:hypothetical protein